MSFNSDVTASNYEFNQEYQVNNTTVSGAIESIGATGPTLGVFPGTGTSANAIGVVEILIPSYASTSFFKVAISTSYSAGGTAGETNARVQGATWKSTAAITAVTLNPPGAFHFIDGTTATLYGML